MSSSALRSPSAFWCLSQHALVSAGSGYRVRVRARVRVVSPLLLEPACLGWTGLGAARLGCQGRAWLQADILGLQAGLLGLHAGRLGLQAARLGGMAPHPRVALGASGHVDARLEGTARAAARLGRRLPVRVAVLDHVAPLRSGAGASAHNRTRSSAAGAPAPGISLPHRFPPAVKHQPARPRWWWRRRRREVTSVQHRAAQPHWAASAGDKQGAESARAVPRSSATR